MAQTQLPPQQDPRFYTDTSVPLEKPQGPASPPTPPALGLLANVKALPTGKSVIPKISLAIMNQPCLTSETMSEHRLTMSSQTSVTVSQEKRPEKEMTDRRADELGFTDVAQHSDFVEASDYFISSGGLSGLNGADKVPRDEKQTDAYAQVYTQAMARLRNVKDLTDEKRKEIAFNMPKSL